MAGRQFVFVVRRAVALALLAAVLVAPNGVDAVHASRAGRGAALVRLRPTDGKHDPQGDGYGAPEHHVCGTHVCVHWVSSTQDAPPLSDANGNGVPDQVDRTVAAFEFAWSCEVGRLGFRAPRSDETSQNHGPDGRLDVYLADIGLVDLDGYVATDDPNASDGRYVYRNYSAYVVVDDDFSFAQLGATGGTGGLRATAAHELFHAVQYAYDSGEDDWLMEGTAAWMEDVVADDVNANRVWLRESPLTQPWMPVDSSQGVHAYGAWIFWRFLSESLGSGPSGATIIKRVWELAADAPGAPNLFSARAVETALGERGRDLGGVFATFGMWNAAPSVFYEEGGVYPHSPITRSHRLSVQHPIASWSALQVDHLTSGAVSFAPSPGAPASAWLRLVLDAPPIVNGSGMRVMIVGRSGAIRVVAVSLDERGDADLRVPFGRLTVRRVLLLYANANTSFDCWTGAGYSCNGRSHADRMSFRYFGALVR
jgi:hypothetical protein